MICLLPLALAAGPRGPVGVVDGDTLRVGGTLVRLQGIDAPELAQTCGDGFRCGIWVRQRVAGHLGGRFATCDDLGPDIYGRVLARCDVGGRDVGQWIVRQGLALAFRRYGQTYVPAEQAALDAGRGLHRLEMQRPSAYRRAKANAEVQEPVPDGCVIKGNISLKGRIYHMPGQAFYATTRVRPQQGERWFCTEQEAQAAGWRRAQR